MSNNELKQKDECCYNAWRKSEAHQCPMTQEGMKAAEERYKQFKVGCGTTQLQERCWN